MIPPFTAFLRPGLLDITEGGSSREDEFQPIGFCGSALVKGYGDERLQIDLRDSISGLGIHPLGYRVRSVRTLMIVLIHINVLKVSKNSSGSKLST